MSVSIRCPKCGQRYNVNSSLDARVIKCRRCETPIEVPSDYRLPPPPGSAPTQSTASVAGRGGDSVTLKNTHTAAPKAAPVAAASNPASPLESRSAVPLSSQATPAHMTPSQVRPAHMTPAQLMAASAPAAAPVAQPVSARSATPAGPAGPIGKVESESVAELLAEQEQEDRQWFRGFRRWMASPSGSSELQDWALSHKLLIADAVVAVFFVAEFLRRGQVFLALLFLLAGVSLTLAGSHPKLSKTPFYHAGAWCYLVVLCIFPFLLTYESSLTHAVDDAIKQQTSAPAPTSTPTKSGQSTAQAPPGPGAAAGAARSEPPKPAGNEATPPRPGAASVADSRRSEPESSTPSTTARPAADRPPPPRDTARENVPSPAAAERSEPPREVAAAPPSDAELRQKAEKAFSDDRMCQAMQYLYVDALSNPKSDLWQHFRYSKMFGRAVLGVRWGVAGELDGLAATQTGIRLGNQPSDPNPVTAQKQLAEGMQKALDTNNLGFRLVVVWLWYCYDEGILGSLDVLRPPSIKEMRAATYLGFDTPVDIQRAARREQLDVVFLFSIRATQKGGPWSVRVVDVVTGENLYASKPKAQPNTIPKDVETALAAMRKQVDLEDLPETLDVAAIQKRLTAMAGRRGENPLAALAELTFYQREKRLTPQQAEELMSILIDPEDAKVLTSGSVADRRLVASKWMPAPAARTP